MFKLMGKKIFRILHSKTFFLSKPISNDFNFAYCVIFHAFFVFSNTISANQFESRSGQTFLTGLIWVKTVCKSYQQTTLIGITR